jgi:N-acetylglucosaminyldiphosphoundecaprenol N-acetyl-beta-D-mannosaminyltransferase
MVKTRLVNNRQYRGNGINILGICYDSLTRQEVLDRMEDFIQQGGTHVISTPNADHVVRAQTDVEFREIIRRSDLVVSDGMAVVYASHLLGTPLKENVGGRMLLPALAQRSAEKGYRLFLMGGSSEQVARLAVERLSKDHPGVNIAGTYTPPFMDEFSHEENECMLSAVNRAKPDVLFVCLGTPKQEKWIARNLKNIQVPVTVGIGVAMDMLAGKVRQPPRWVSDIGFEWMYRLIQEPRRLAKRYLVDDPVFFWWVLRQRMGL